MFIDKVQVARRFNRAASTYDQHAVIQKQMAQRLLQHLPRCKQPFRRICEIGCGTGYLTKLLLQRYPQAELVAIDLAAQMVEKAKTSVRSSNVDWIVGDAEQWDVRGWEPFDVVVSNATIQWLSNPKRTLRLWQDTLHPNGWFVASTLGVDTFQEISALWQQVELELGMLPSRYQLPLHSALFWQQLLEQVGFTSVTVEEDWQQSKYPDCRTFLQTVKAMGASYSETKLSLPSNRRLLQTVMQRYDDRYRIGSQVYATYHVIHCYGQKE
jgi:malonyl-CoA O-methyltransferase